MFHLIHWNVPDEISPEMKEVCVDLRQCKTQLDCVCKAYEIVSNRFTVSRMHTYLRWDALLDTNVHSIWHRTEFLHCTHLNHLMKVLLVHSGWFTKKHIRTRWTHVWGISPHQYLRVYFEDGSHLNVDPWGRHYGVPFGSYVRGWNGSFKKVWRPNQQPPPG